MSSAEPSEGLRRFTLQTGSMRVVLCSLGARVLAVEVLTKKSGRPEWKSVALGYNSDAAIEADPFYMGASCGRFANRIANASYGSEESGKAKLCANNGPHTLHGGTQGFDRRVWAVGASPTETELEFQLDSPDGDNGFPGAVTIGAKYSIKSDEEAGKNSLQIRYSVIPTATATVVTSSAPVVCNVVSHVYWNLGESSALNHYLQLDAPSYTPVDSESIPTGEIRLIRKEDETGGTDQPPDAFNFLQEQCIRDRMPLLKAQCPSCGEGKQQDEGLYAGGYDHNFVLGDGTTFSHDPQPASTPAIKGLRQVAKLRSPTSGLTLTVESTSPGLQFYAGNYLTRHPHLTPVTGQHSGLCLEAQAFPDAPNRPNFPSAFLVGGHMSDANPEFTPLRERGDTVRKFSRVVVYSLEERVAL